MDLEPGLLTGFGVLEACLLIGGSVAALVVLRDVPRPRWLSLSLLAWLALGVAVANLIPLALDGGGLGHDESAYALKARHWIEGTPETGWNVHRGVAMSGYGYLVLSAGGEEGALRLLGVAAIVGLAAATWVLGAKLGGRYVGPLAAIAVVSSPALLRRSTEYLSDVPAAALLVACMVVVWREFAEREVPSYRLAWILPLAWAAFYLRYQSALSFALIAITVLVLFWEKVKAGWRAVAVTAAVGLAGLVPHLVFATSETGSPIGVLLFTAEVAGREFYGEGLVDYVLLMGWPLAAFVGPVAAVFFVWWLTKSWRSESRRMRPLFLMIPVVGQVVTLGVVSHGEARFVFFPLALTLVGGITGLEEVTRDWRPVVAKAVRVGAVVLLIGSLALSAADVRRGVEDRILETEPVELSAEAVRELSGTAPCGVMTSYSPQITYYSACFTAPFRTHLTPTQALSRLSGEERFLLLIEDGKRQPSGSDLGGLLEITDGETIEIEGQRESAEIYEFEDD